MGTLCVSVAQSRPTLCDPVDCSLPGSFVHGIFQARIVEWVAISHSRASSRFRDQSCVCFSCTGRQTLYHCTTWEDGISAIILQNDYNELLQFQVERSLVRFTPRYFIPFAVTVNGFSLCL